MEAEAEGEEGDLEEEEEYLLSHAPKKAKRNIDPEPDDDVSPSDFPMLPRIKNVVKIMGPVLADYKRNDIDPFRSIPDHYDEVSYYYYYCLI